MTPPRRLPKRLATALLLAAAPVGAVALLAATGVRGHLPFAAAAFDAPYAGLAAAALGGGWRNALAATAATAPALAVAFALGGSHAGRLVPAGALVLAVALACAGVARAARAAGPAFAILLLAGACGSPWWVEPFLRGIDGAEARAAAAGRALAVNPIAAACDLFGTDWMRRERMYAASSIGADLPFRYPRWERWSLAAAALGIILCVLPARAGGPRSAP